MATAAPISTAEPAWRAAAALVVMMAGQSVGSLIFAVPPPVLPLMAREYGSNGAFVAQMVLSLSAFGLMVGALISGWVVERAGVRYSIVGSLIALGVFGSAMMAIHAVWLVFASRLLLGLAASFTTTACTILLMQTYHGEARGRVIGYQIGVASGVSVLCIVLAGGMAQSLGWRAPFGVYGVFAALVLPCALASVPREGPRSVAQPQSGAFGPFRLWPLYVTGASLFVFAIGVGAQLPFLLKDQGVTSPVVQAAVIGALTVANLLTSLAFGRVNVALGQRRTFGLGLLSLGAGFAVIGLLPGAWAAGVGTTLTGVGMGLFIPQLWLRTAELAPEPVRGRALGFLNAGMFFGGFGSPFVFGPLHALLGLAGAFIALGSAATVGAVGVIVFRPRSLVAD